MGEVLSCHLHPTRERVDFCLTTVVILNNEFRAVNLFTSIIQKRIVTLLSTVLIVLPAISLIGYLTVILLTHRLTDNSSSKTLFLGAVGTTALMIAGFILQIIAPSQLIESAAFHARWALQPPAALFWALFALYYTNRDGFITETVVRLLAIQTILSSLLFATNPLHYVVWRSYTVSTAGLPLFYGLRTPIFWLLTGLIYIIPLAGILVLFQSLWKSKNIGQDQTVLLGATALFNIVVDGAARAGMLPVDGYDYFSVTSLLFVSVLAYLLITKQLLVVPPISRPEILDAVDDPIVVLTQEEIIIDYNNEADAVFKNLNSGCQFEHVNSSLLTDGGEQTRASIPVDRAVGSRKFEISTERLTHRGSISGYLIHFRDITSTVEYADDLVTQTQRVNTFIDVVSHDLRNPLSAARGQVELSRQQSGDAQLDDIDRLLRRMESIIDNLLAVAKQTGTPDREPVKLATLCHDCWQYIDAPRAELVVETEQAIQADRAQLKRVLENLFRNAVEHGSQTVTIRVGELDPQRGFFIADNGDGISEKQQKQLFEHGYTGTADGIGIGLAIVQQVVAAHGWTITVQESESGGAQFEITDVDIVQSGAYP